MPTHYRYRASTGGHAGGHLRRMLCGYLETSEVPVEWLYLGQIALRISRGVEVWNHESNGHYRLAWCKGMSLQYDDLITL
jgi:hypothetical protein